METLGPGASKQLVRTSRQTPAVTALTRPRVRKVLCGIQFDRYICYPSDNGFNAWSLSVRSWSRLGTAAFTLYMQSLP
jgi:hypothetical protein